MTFDLDTKSIYTFKGIGCNWMNEKFVTIYSKYYSTIEPILLSFSNLYILESGFSHEHCLVIKQRTTLNIERCDLWYRIYTPIFLNGLYATCSWNKDGGRQYTNQSREPIGQENHVVSANNYVRNFNFSPTFLEPTPWQEFSIDTLIFQHSPSFSFSEFHLEN